MIKVFILTKHIVFEKKKVTYIDNPDNNTIPNIVSIYNSCTFITSITLQNSNDFDFLFKYLLDNPPTMLVYSFDINDNDTSYGYQISSDIIKNGVIKIHFPFDVYLRNTQNIYKLKLYQYDTMKKSKTLFVTINGVITVSQLFDIVVNDIIQTTPLLQTTYTEDKEYSNISLF